MRVTQVKLNAAAKINLTLDIKGQREDGYHEIETIMQSISLYDIVKIKATTSGSIDIKMSVPFVPCDNRNTCHKAAQLYFDNCGIENPGIEINVQKNIPSAAGLGGGSADAAAVLRGLEYIFGKCREDIFLLAKNVGADVPFCLAGGTNICRGIGEILTPIHIKSSCTKNMHLVIAKNTKGLSTPYIYSKYDNYDKSLLIRPQTNKMVEALKSGNPSEVASFLVNVLESVSIEEKPEISFLKNEMLEMGALNSMMTGSGTAVFGIFDNFTTAHACYEKLKNDGVFAEYAKFLSLKPMTL